MPVTIPDDLPAAKILQQENISYIPSSRAITQDVRPLRIGIVNNMPQKPQTETQLLRLLSNSPLQVEVTFLRSRPHQSRNTAPEHLARFYSHSFEDVRNCTFDGLIITGADVETLPYEQVTYWDEFRAKLDWTRSHVYSTLHVCWGAQAGLYHHHNVPKHQVASKVFGIFEHTTLYPHDSLLHGFDEVFLAPHSRHTEVRESDLVTVDALRTLATSAQAGVYLVGAHNNRQVFVMGHPEYDLLTLQAEYCRDIQKGIPIDIPAHYYPDDDPSKKPVMRWRSHAQLLISNWLHDIYQNTPYNIRDLKPI